MRRKHEEERKEQEVTREEDTRVNDVLQKPHMQSSMKLESGCMRRWGAVASFYWVTEPIEERVRTERTGVEGTSSRRCC